MTVDPRAVRGFGSAEAYERGRPTYPPAAIQNLSRELGLGPESTVLDLAAGTGKLTRALVRHAGRVIAVEPSPSMIGVLRERLPEIDAREGTAEAIPVETGPSMRCASVRASTGSGRPKRQGRSRGCSCPAAGWRCCGTAPTGRICRGTRSSSSVELDRQPAHR